MDAELLSPLGWLVCASLALAAVCQAAGMALAAWRGRREKS